MNSPVVINVMSDATVAGVIRKMAWDVLRVAQSSGNRQRDTVGIVGHGDTFVKHVPCCPYYPIRRGVREKGEERENGKAREKTLYSVSSSCKS